MLLKFQPNCVGLSFPFLAPLPVFRHTARPMKPKSSAKKSRITHHASRRVAPKRSEGGITQLNAPVLKRPRGRTRPRRAARHALSGRLHRSGIASTWSNVTPCNRHVDKLALEAEKGTNDGGGKAIVFNTITISDILTARSTDRTGLGNWSRRDR
jgi:dihydroxyacid dehydratase/phosphogluconate dehydratase